MERILDLLSEENKTSQETSLRLLIELLVDKTSDKQSIASHLNDNPEFSATIFSLISIDSALDLLVLAIPFVCFLTDYNKDVVVTNWDNILKVLNCLLGNLDGCSSSQINSHIFFHFQKLINCLYVSFPVELIKDVRVIVEGFLESGIIAKTNLLVNALALSGLHPKLVLPTHYDRSVDSQSNLNLNYDEEFRGVFNITTSFPEYSVFDVPLTIGSQDNEIIDRLESPPRQFAYGNNLEQSLFLVERCFSSLNARKVYNNMERLNHVQSQNHFLELKVAEQKKQLESQKLENAKLLEVVRELNVKLSSTKLKNDEIYDNLVSTEEYSEQLENQLKKVTEELAGERKRFSVLFNENCAVKAKLFECSEMKNKLARKVDTSVASELMLHKLSNEVFMMNELHLRYEDKLNHMSSLAAHNDRHLDTLLSAGGSSNNAGIVALKRNLEAAQRKTKELQRDLEERTRLNEDLDKEVTSLKTDFQSETEIMRTVIRKYESEIQELAENLSKAGNRTNLLNCEIQVLKTKRRSDQREKCVGTQ